LPSLAGPRRCSFYRRLYQAFYLAHPSHGHKAKKKNKNKNNKTSHPTEKSNKRGLGDFYPIFSKPKYYIGNRPTYYDDVTYEKNNKTDDNHSNFTIYFEDEAQGQPEATPPTAHTEAHL
jgi:hypothetical protein